MLGLLRKFWGRATTAPISWIALFVLADIAVFSSRAVYLDEPFFIALARIPKSFGLFFEDRQWVFFGTPYPMFGGGSHPPAVIYYLAALYSLLGRFKEVPFRILYSVFGIAAAVGFHELARRLCKAPLGVTLLFVASPAFFVMTQTLMMDIPMLGFFLLGLHFYFGRLDGSPPRLILAAICFSFAVLSGYTALVPLGCLLFAALLTRQSASRLVALLAAPCVLGAWILLTFLHYHKDPLTPVVRYFASVHSVKPNLLALPSFLGGCTVFPWLFLVFQRHIVEKSSRKLLLGLSLAVAAGLSSLIVWESIGYGAWFILLSSSGIALLCLFSVIATRTLRDQRTPLTIFLVLWFPATILFFILVAEFISARYLLLAIPPLYLLLFNRSTSGSIAAMFVPTLILSLLIATADYRFVNSYPKWVSANAAPLQKQGFRILSAAESGLRFYLEEQGINTLSSSDLRASPGDLIVRPSTFLKYSLAEDVETMLIRLRTDELKDDFPIRTFSAEAGAGFHGSSLGLVPYAFSRAPHDRIDIWELSPLVEKLPQVPAPGKPVPVWSPEGPVLIQEEPELSFRLRLPDNARLEYDVEGSGSAEIIEGQLRLRKNGAGRVVWKNLRIVPN